MATYTSLSYGSQGSDVTKLQQALRSAGYYKNGKVDGDYGAVTQQAVKEYQRDNGLAVDGVAGDVTLGRLYGTGSGADSQTTPAQQPKTPADYSGFTYDASSDQSYQQALSALQEAQKTRPAYAATYDDQLDDLYDKIVNREKFSYDLNGDMLYQQYRDQYALMGQQAMMDTMGQAASLTGGYGNSWAQTAGQQAYQGYLRQLNDVVPQLYAQALDQYNAEGDRMSQQYAMTGDLADREYGRYQDALSEHWNNVNYLSGQADDAYSRGYENWYNAYQMGVDAENTAYARQQDAYDRLADLIASTGYSPTSAELAAAGMTGAQANAYRSIFGGVSGGGSSGGGGGSSKKSSGGSKKASGSSEKKDVPVKTYNNGMTASEIQKAAEAYVKAHPNVTIDSMTIDGWLYKNGYGGESSQLFKYYMQEAGAKTSGRR